MIPIIDIAFFWTILAAIWLAMMALAMALINGHGMTMGGLAPPIIRDMTRGLAGRRPCLTTPSAADWPVRSRYHGRHRPR